MFWRLLPMLFLVSSVGAIGLIISGTFRENDRLRKALSPAELEHAVQRVLQDSAALPNLEGQLAAWCEDPLHVLSERILSKLMADRSGDANPNSFHRAALSGRLAVTLHTAAGASCTFPVNGAERLPALREQMAAAERGEPGAQATIVDLPDSWISVTTVEPEAGRGQRLVVGVQILSPMAKLMQPKELLGPLAIFLVIMNTLMALFLVLLIVRRIKRADEVAQAWTSGDLGARIKDPGRDEFARLTHKFDMMADAMSGVIEVKQALAAAEERNRLARDLHDSSKQRAFALNLQLSVMQKRVEPQGDIASLIAAALTLTGQLQHDLDSVIQRLAAPTIAESGFRHALAQGIDALLAGSGIAWTLFLDERDEKQFGAMPEVARELLLITVEAVANALKHARCTDCWISGERMGRFYAWSIADNGSASFPSNVGPKGMGLANMRLRAGSLPGGTFTIFPRDGGGTTILVTFHLAALEQE